MLFIIGVAIMLVAFEIIPRMRMRPGVPAADLGWMSTQWLAEHRSSHIA
jgi:hypothetical protein